MNRNLQSLLLVRSSLLSQQQIREKHYKVVISGAGAGGLGLATRINKKLRQGELAIIDPSETHYYQPYFTCYGAGIVDFDATHKKTQDLIPKNCEWVKEKVTQFVPKENKVLMGDKEITYDFLVICMGIGLDLEKIKGSQAALDKDPRVCTNYSSHYVTKTFPAYKNFKQGQTAVFTFPSTPVKCAGGAQKVMYLFEDFLRQNNLREGSNISYFSGGPKMFSVDHYARKLLEIAANKGINVSLDHEIIEVNHEKSEVVILSHADKSKKTVKYDFLHMTPPMKVPECLSQSDELCLNRFLAVNKHTLRHDNFENIFGIGDCTNLPTSKTAASASTQVGVVEKNLMKAIEKSDQPLAHYDGYSSCPILTSYNSGIIAEFDYTLQPKESLPIDQSVERRIFSFIKKSCLPIMYWDFLMKGLWTGPAPIRKYLNFRKDRYTVNKQN